MKKLLLLSIAALIMSAGGAFAAGNTPTGTMPPSHEEHGMPPHGDDMEMGKDWTLDEARKRAHEHADKAREYAEKLDKMTEEDWAKHLKKRHEFMERLNKMTPEQREEFFKNRREKREEWREKHDGDVSGNHPANTPPTPNASNNR